MASDFHKNLNRNLICSRKKWTLMPKNSKKKSSKSKRKVVPDPMMEKEIEERERINEMIKRLRNKTKNTKHGTIQSRRQGNCNNKSF